MIVVDNLASFWTHIQTHSLLMPFKYLTMYVCVLVLFSKWTHKWIDLMFLTSMVISGAFVLFHVHPGYLKICEKMNIDGWLLNVVDVLFHLFPFLWVVFRYRRYYIEHAWGRGTAWAFLMVILYVMFGQPYTTYDADVRVGVIAMLVGGILYACLVSPKKLVGIK